MKTLTLFCLIAVFAEGVLAATVAERGDRAILSGRQVDSQRFDAEANGAVKTVTTDTTVPSSGLKGTGALSVSATEGGIAFSDSTRKKVPFIYCSDIFHPAMDPDDHFDLAAVFAFDEFDIKALVLDGHIDRKGQDQFNGGGRIPLSQMCRITGRSVPAAVGLNVKLEDPLDVCGH